MDHSPPLTVASATLQSHAVRIPPNANVVPALLEAAQQAMSNSNANSAFVITAVGSLSSVTLRMAATDNSPQNSHVVSTDTDCTCEVNSLQSRNHDEAQTVSLKQTTSMRVQTIPNHLEIVSLVGTFSMDGGKHLHMSVANAEGNVMGGHLIAGKVFTTIELVLGTMPGVAFEREMDAVSGFKELFIRPS